MPLVELDVVFVQVAAGQALDRNEIDALDADVSKVCHGVQAREQVGQAGGRVGAGIMAGPGNRQRADRGDAPVQIGGDLDVHAGVASLAGVQIGNRPPVPGRTGGAVDEVGAERSADLRR
jgi:hypothetical protein